MSVSEHILKTNKIELSDHAFEQMKERFPQESRNKQSATNYIRSLLKSSKYIGIVPDSLGVDAHFYVHNARTAIHIAPETEIVKTIYTLDKSKPVLPFRQRIENIYQTEYRKLGRAELAIKKKLKYTVAECEAEIAQLKLRRLKTRSENVKKECDDKISNLNNRIWALNNKLKNTQKQRREIAFVIATENY